MAKKVEEVRRTHEDKVMFPEKGYTKGDVLDFYERISPYLLPHLKDRPMTLQRFPDGVGEGALQFWQKNTPDYYPAWIKRVAVRSEEDPNKVVKYVLVNDVQTLLYLVNQGAITFHPFLARVKNLNRPDYLMFDLDPGEAGFGAAVETAKALHKRLEKEGVGSFPKTSGKSGLHVVVAWKKKGSQAGYDAARDWLLEVARDVVAELPKVATLERMKANRRGRLYLDVMQNSPTKHIVPPYVLRAVSWAGVSTPLTWSEVNGKLKPGKFDLKTIFKRLKGEDLMGAVAS